MEKQQLEDRSINYIQVVLYTESGCDPSEGEYSLFINGFTGCLDLSSTGGVDDISLIKEAIEEAIDFTTLPKEGCTEVMLKESGEWEDVFWHKYYVVENVVMTEA